MPDLRACWLVRAWPVTRRGRACRKPTSRGSLTQPPAAGGGGGGGRGVENSMEGHYMPSYTPSRKKKKRFGNNVINVELLIQSF